MLAGLRAELEALADDQKSMVTSQGGLPGLQAAPAELTDENGNPKISAHRSKVAMPAAGGSSHDLRGGLAGQNLGGLGSDGGSL